MVSVASVSEQLFKLAGCGVTLDLPIPFLPVAFQ
jgi:hypothetical protein